MALQVTIDSDPETSKDFWHDKDMLTPEEMLSVRFLWLAAMTYYHRCQLLFVLFFCVRVYIYCVNIIWKLLC